MIEVGEWIRLKDGRIRQLKWTDGINAQWTRPFGEGLLKEIVKHSKNIIDLIEVGDIVNKVYMSSYMDVYVRFIRDKQDIETILTKEQYMQNCYKIPEKKSGND